MARIPVQIGPTLFESIKGVKEYVRSILWSVEIGERIVNKEHDQILRDMFADHPNIGEKLSDHEIVGFKVDHRDGGTRCFYVIRNDGKAVHFSFKKCLSNLDRHWFEFEESETV